MRPSADQVRKMTTPQEKQYLDTVGRNLQLFQQAQTQGTGQRSVPNLAQEYSKAKMRESIPSGAFAPVATQTSRGFMSTVPPIPFTAPTTAPDKTADVATKTKTTVSAKQKVATPTQTPVSSQYVADTTGGLGKFAMEYVLGDQTGAGNKSAFDYPAYLSFVEATRGKKLTPEQQAYAKSAKENIFTNPDAISSEVARARQMIADMQAKGQDVTAQQNYLNQLTARQEFLKANPFAARAATSDELANRQYRESEQAFQQQLENLNKQRQLDTQELARQLEGMKEGNLQKSYARMRQAFQNLANRGMLGSGLNWLAQNQEAMTSQAEAADMMNKYAQRLQQLGERYGTKQEQITQKRAERTPEYFRKQQADLLKSLGQQQGAGSETRAQQVSRLGSFITALANAGVKQSDLQGIIRDALGQTITSPEGVPVKTAKQLNKEADQALRQQQIAISAERASNQFAAKSINDKAKITISLYKALNTIEDSNVKRMLTPILKNIDVAKAKMFALPKYDEKQAKVFFEQIEPQINNALAQIGAIVGNVQNEGTLKSLEQALSGIAPKK